MPDVDHRQAALMHLRQAADAPLGTDLWRHHHNAAATQASLEAAEAGRTQAEAVLTAARINAEILAAFTQPPTPVPPADFHCNSCDGHSCPDIG